MNLVIKSFIKIIRPANFIITFFSVIVAAAICVEENYQVYKIILAAISASFTLGAGNILNDIKDTETDKINHPARPLAANNISAKQALIEYRVFILVSLLFSWFINVYAFLMVIAVTIVLYFYSHKFKKIPLLGNIIVSILTGLVFIYGGIAVNNPFAAIIPAAFAFMLNLIREVVKDMQDLEGDLKQGIVTFPGKYGISSSNLLIVELTIVLILLTFYPFIAGLYNIEFFILVMAIVNPLLIYSLKILFNEQSHSRFNKISAILKLNMFIGIIAIVLGI